MNDALMLGLEGALEDEGWGHPARFFVIEGSMESPIFKPLAEISDHPCNVLAEMWADGVRLAGEPIGLALVAEGVRHLRFEELQERAAPTYAKMTQIAEEAIEDGQIQTAVQKVWEDLIADTPVQHMPDELRVKVRNSVAVEREGWTLMVVRDQDGEPEVLAPVPPERLWHSRVPHFMWLFLTGQEPKD